MAFDPDRDCQHPWLRVNLLLREMTRLFRDRSARPILKVELNNAIKMRERLRRHISWN